MEDLLKHFITEGKLAEAFFKETDSLKKCNSIELYYFMLPQEQTTNKGFKICIGDQRQKETYAKKHTKLIPLGWVHDTIWEPACTYYYASDYDYSAYFNPDKNEMFWCIDLPSCLYLFKEYKLGVTKFSDKSNDPYIGSLIEYFKKDLGFVEIDSTSDYKRVKEEELMSVLP